ncbi:MAG: acylphosphatase [Emcibacteraceae bacterium]|nr:acylphosphatase [Emcibacteraceae bacterium]MDG1857668.1 acylphosphatase [Emcibacteraceae bacterium]
MKLSWSLNDTMLEEGHKAVRVLIFGRVQGVFFRDWTVKTALSYELNGWVRNRTDGTVEALMVGLEEAVDKMVKECWFGPPSAKVDEIKVSTAIGITKAGFEQKPTVNMNESRSL